MAALAPVLFGLFIVLAGLHLYWAVGGLWPGDDERSLVERVIGRTPGMRMPPAWITAGVVASLVAAAFVVAAYAGWVATPLPRFVVEGAMVLLTLVFGVRGAAGYLPAFNRPRAGTPFVRLNALLYSPLCLGIAAGLAVLWSSGEGRVAQPFPTTTHRR